MAAARRLLPGATDLLRRTPRFSFLAGRSSLESQWLWGLFSVMEVRNSGGPAAKHALNFQRHAST